MRRPTRASSKLADKESQHGPAKRNNAEQPEAIKKCVDCSLTLNQSLHLSESVRRRVGGRKAMLHELAGETLRVAFRPRSELVMCDAMTVR
jgi:hypothetical protein